LIALKSPGVRALAGMAIVNRFDVIESLCKVLPRQDC
jgi:hypothetical protein